MTNAPVHPRGALPKVVDPRDWTVQDHPHLYIGDAPMQLPDMVDLRGWLPGRTVSKASPVGPVRRQVYGDCVGEAISLLRGALRARAGAPPLGRFGYSPTYLWRAVRNLYVQTGVDPNALRNDGGIDPDTCLKYVMQHGAAPYDADPDTDPAWQQAPSVAQVAAGRIYPIASYHLVTDHLSTIQVLAGLTPVICQVKAYEQWDALDSSGRFPNETDLAQDERDINHQVTIVAYAWDGYIIQNSWGGPQPGDDSQGVWGWDGCCWISYENADKILFYRQTASLSAPA